MSQFFTSADLVGMNEQELRALYGRLLSDLGRCPQSRFITSDIHVSLQVVQQALCRAQQTQYASAKPRGPSGLKF